MSDKQSNSPPVPTKFSPNSQKPPQLQDCEYDVKGVPIKSEKEPKSSKKIHYPQGYLSRCS